MSELPPRPFCGGEIMMVELLAAAPEPSQETGR